LSNTVSVNEIVKLKTGLSYNCLYPVLTFVTSGNFNDVIQ